MMWTQEKSKTPERLAELKQIHIKYNKILSIIVSCTSMAHIECCYIIIDNFEHYCKSKKVVHTSTIVANLKNYLRLKKRNIWPT